MDVTLALILILLVTLAAIFLKLSLKLRRKTQMEKLGLPQEAKVISFFHPFCDNGGGGERVLWIGVRLLQRKFPKDYILIYSWSGLDPSKMKKLINEQFGIFDLNWDLIIFAPLYSWKYLESSRYPRLTLFLSSLGSIIPGIEALFILRSKILVETVGFAFIYPIGYAFGSKIIAYVHYPTISSDMLRAIETRKSAFNNNTMVANSAILSTAKLYYYRLFSKLYGFVGSYCSMAMVNSSWTAGHIKDIWKIDEKRISLVFPPCDTQKLLVFPLDRNQERQRLILSIAQFRPEKNHRLMLESVACLLSKNPEFKKTVKLVLLGSVRNEADEKRVNMIHEIIKELDLINNVEIVKNAPYSLLLDYLKNSFIGLHAMHNEHFGISIIEYMAAGLIPLANKSGGPLMDIVSEPGLNGFLADTVDSYASQLEQILNLDKSACLRIRKAARLQTAKFSEQAFSEGFLSCF